MFRKAHIGAAAAALLAIAMIGPGCALASTADPQTSTFQKEVCSVLKGPLPGGGSRGGDAAGRRIGEIEARFGARWNVVALASRAEGSTCRKPAGRILGLRVSDDRRFAVISGGGRRDRYYVDCYYERTASRWRQIGCLATIGLVE